MPKFKLSQHIVVCITRIVSALASKPRQQNLIEYCRRSSEGCLSPNHSHFDDIICHVVTLGECATNLRACLKRLAENDLHVNCSKCSFFEQKIEHLGHLIEFNPIRKSPAKIKAVADMLRPTNADGDRRFLGLLTYYSRFIPDFSTLYYPLRRLLCVRQRFIWKSDCESAFLKLMAVI